MKKWLVIVSCFVAFLGLGACANKQDQAKNEKLKVVVTNSILADITKNIAGNKIDLHSIVPVGKDPHEYEPLPADVVKNNSSRPCFLQRN